MDTLVEVHSQFSHGGRQRMEKYPIEHCTHVHSLCTVCLNGQWDCKIWSTHSNLSYMLIVLLNRFITKSKSIN